MNSLNEATYELILDDQGLARVNTQTIIGELRSLLFKVVENSLLSGFIVSVDLADCDIRLLKEEIHSDTYYPLLVQSHDGFGQFNAEFVPYLLNDSLTITVQGAPFSSLICTLRWL